MKCPFCHNNIIVYSLINSCECPAPSGNAPHHPRGIFFSDDEKHECGTFYVIFHTAQEEELFWRYREKAIKENKKANSKGKTIIWTVDSEKICPDFLKEQRHSGKYIVENIET